MSGKTINGWTEEQVRDLAAAHPEFAARMPDGTVVPTMSRDEAVRLAQAYPSMKLFSGTASAQAMNEGLEEERNAAAERRYASMPKGTQPAAPAPTGNAEEDALRARYPSMCRG